MTSHIQFFRDQLRQFDANVAEWRREIDERYTWIAKEQEARLRVQAMMEQIFGESEGTVVMQDMALKPGLEARQPAMALAAPQAAVSEEERADRERERLRLREHTQKRRDYKREYKRRQRIAQQHLDETRNRLGPANGSSIDERLDEVRKVRSDKGTRRANGNGRHRSYSDQVQRIFLDRPTTPLMAGEIIDMVFPVVVPTKREKQNVYQVLFTLKQTGFLAQSHANEPYTLAQREMNGAGA